MKIVASRCIWVRLLLPPVEDWTQIPWLATMPMKSKGKGPFPWDLWPWLVCLKKFYYFACCRQGTVFHKTPLAFWPKFYKVFTFLYSPICMYEVWSSFWCIRATTNSGRTNKRTKCFCGATIFLRSSIYGFFKNLTLFYVTVVDISVIYVMVHKCKCGWNQHKWCKNIRVIFTWVLGQYRQERT